MFGQVSIKVAQRTLHYVGNARIVNDPEVSVVTVPLPGRGCSKYYIFRGGWTK